ncbi:hypothetical protein GALMADRAFT_135536 [Galerina marginata CBS 339.88]|uniref:Uncharacterized protein n=1 Tax=Galerina marginata (strain CBS 339.88) TaxID=685588 RepID=A0A067TG30_GALM3|nr:hypothetical protein GALMADRAFT_135536 [Galerina marginata CBS 339.88]
MELYIAAALPTNTNLKNLWAAFYAATMTLYTLGFDLLYYDELAFLPRRLSRQTNLGDADNFNLDFDTNRLISEVRQWSQILVKMVKTWKVVRNACILEVPLSLAFFQVNGVNSNIYARTSALSACVCSSAALVACSLYSSLLSGPANRRLRRKWLEASRSLNTRGSIDFWVFFAWPISSLVWSIVFSISAIGIAVWTSAPDVPAIDAASAGRGRIDASVVTSAVFLTVLIIVQVIQVYRGVKFFREE